MNGEFTIVYNSINGIDDKKSNKKAILSIPFGVKGGIKSNEENVIILPTGEKKKDSRQKFPSTQELRL